MNYSDQIARLAGLINENKRFYVLTGAGISTDSGIPDFRSPGTGLWEKIDPIAVSSAEVLYNNPKVFYEEGFKRFSKIASAEPNPGHHILARMEELGFIEGLVTQNIDGLHVKAGSNKIWEVHGHLRSGHCTSCKMQYPFDELVQQVALDQIPPLCHHCAGMLRPEVVLFGDPMPSFFFELRKTIRDKCDLMLVVGSSLEVYPVAELPLLAKKLAIINLQPTDYDGRAEVVIRENCSQVLTDLLKQLNDS